MKWYYRIERFRLTLFKCRKRKWWFMYGSMSIADARAIVRNIHYDEPKWQLRIYGYREKKYLSNTE